MFRLIVGLGNPGKEYALTRHNAGFMAVERLAKAEGARFRNSREWGAEVAAAEGVIFCKPTSFMNRSGEPVSAVARYYKVEPSEVFIVLDDVAIPLGKLRLRPSGSSGGHNGLRSIIDMLGTQEISRLRIGIGAPEGSGEMIGHVLGRFDPEEAVVLDEALDRAVVAIRFARENGIVAAMNKFN